MGLTLDLLRHGLSQPAGPNGDRLRELAPAGIEALAVLAGRLAAEGWAPARIFSSPYLRALQTARIVARGADVAAPVEPLTALEPEREPEGVLGALAALGVTGGHVLLVGHQPLVGLLAGYLTGATCGIGTGTLVRVECADGPRRRGGRITRVLAPGDPG